MNRYAIILSTKHRSGNKCRTLNVAADARPQGVDVLANVATTVISRKMLSSCGRQTAGSRRSGERSYDCYFPNDVKLTV